MSYGINWKKIWEEILKMELSRHLVRREAIQNIRMKIEELESDYSRLRAAQSDASPVQGGGSSMEDRLINNIALRDNLKNRLDYTFKQWNRIERALKRLTVEQQKIIYGFYIDRPENYRQILCEELGIEQSELYRQKDQAMEILVLMLYGEG